MSRELFEGAEEVLGALACRVSLVEQGVSDEEFLLFEEVVLRGRRDVEFWSQDPVVEDLLEQPQSVDERRGRGGNG